jgi:hypothetical protein
MLTMVILIGSKYIYNCTIYKFWNYSTGWEGHRKKILEDKQSRYLKSSWYKYLTCATRCDGKQGKSSLIFDVKATYLTPFPPLLLPHLSSHHAHYFLSFQDL